MPKSSMIGLMTKFNSRLGVGRVHMNYFINERVVFFGSLDPEYTIGWNTMSL